MRMFLFVSLSPSSLSLSSYVSLSLVSDNESDHSFCQLFLYTWL